MKVTRHRNAIPGPRVGRGAGGAMTLSQRRADWLCLRSCACWPSSSFPATQEPYSVVHGPVTVRQAAGAAAGLRMAVDRAGLNSVRRRVSAALVLLPGAAGRGAEFQSSALATGAGITLGC